MKLTSNTILITGGGSGIGYELTKQLTALGNTILITGRRSLKGSLIDCTSKLVSQLTDNRSSEAIE